MGDGLTASPIYQLIYQLWILLLPHPPPLWPTSCHNPSMPRTCDNIVFPNLKGFSQAIACELRPGHRGRHRGEFASWENGGAEFAPDDYTVGGTPSEDDDDDDWEFQMTRDFSEYRPENNPPRATSD